VLQRYPGFPGLEEQYALIVRSGLGRVLDLVKTAPDTNKLDEISLLEAIKVSAALFNYLSYVHGKHILKGTLTRNILAFFIIFNGKSVFF
jgi:hypothetical protein